LTKRYLQEDRFFFRSCDSITFPDVQAKCDRAACYVPWVSTEAEEANIRHKT